MYGRSLAFFSKREIKGDIHPKGLIPIISVALLDIKVKWNVCINWSIA